MKESLEEQLIKEFNELFPFYPDEPIYGAENRRRRRKEIDFIFKKISQERSRIKKEVEEIEDPYQKGDFRDGYETALDDILKIIG